MVEFVVEIVIVIVIVIVVLIVIVIVTCNYDCGRDRGCDCDSTHNRFIISVHASQALTPSFQSCIRQYHQERHLINFPGYSRIAPCFTRYY